MPRAEARGFLWGLLPPCLDTLLLALFLSLLDGVCHVLLDHELLELEGTSGYADVFSFSVGETEAQGWR